MGHLRLIIGYLKATVVHIRLTLGHLRVTIGRLFFSTSQHKANTTELHPKVSSWMLNGFTKFHFMEVVSSCFWTSTAAPLVIRERSLVTQIVLLSACRDDAMTTL